jgi:hypothetical protein
MSVSSYLLSKSPMMQVVWVASTPILVVFMGAASLPKHYMWDAEVEPCRHEIVGVGS